MVSSVGDIEQLRRETTDGGAISAPDKNLLLPDSDLTMISSIFFKFFLVLDNVFYRESRDELKYLVSV